MEKKRFNIDLDDPAFTKERTPIKPQFQPSSRGGQSVSSSSASAAQPAPQPLSYAEFVVQSKKHVPPPPQVPSAPRANTGFPSGPDPASHTPNGSVSLPTQDQAKRTDGEEDGRLGVKQREQMEITGTDQKHEEGQMKEPGLSLGPKLVGSGNSIIVSPRQRGNPILKYVRSVPWEFGEVVPDYVLGQTTCALFLSLRYHNLNPNYIHERLKQLGQTFTLRVLLVQVDVKDPHHSLKELARICIMADCTLILAWSPEEAGRYLETYKSYEKKPADLLKEHVEKDYLSKVTDCLTTVKSVNKTDAITLLSTFSR
ncbi:DNA excision repair protein ERCC-1 isoform 2-T2 [Polymixia lowei]